MAINFHAKSQFLGSVHDHDLFKPNVPNRKQATNIAFQSIHKRNRVIGSQLFESSPNYEPPKKAQVQELVDQLHRCAEKWLHTRTRVIHAYVLKSSVSVNDSLILLNHVMHAYSKCSDFKSVKTVFNSLPRKNVFSWSVMIVGFNHQSFFRDGFYYFCEMLMDDDGISPDGFVYSAVLQSCIGLNSLDLGKTIHAHIIMRGFGSHVVVSTALLNMYAKMGKVHEAYKVFDSMVEHNDVSWNAMISGLTVNSLHKEAFDFFLNMKKKGFVPDMFTLISVSKAVGMLGDVEKGKRVHECVLESGLRDNVRVGTAVIDMYSKCGRILDARCVFDTGFADCGVNGPWNAMISGYTFCNCSEQALQLFVEMRRKNVKTDIYTYGSVFNAVAKLKRLGLVKEVHGVFLRSCCDFLTDLSVNNAILDAYAKCGSLEEVNKIFDNMTQRDIVTWTTLVAGFSQCFKFDEALVVFSRMRDEGFAPNNFTLASVLTSCANLCHLEYGRQIHGLVCKLGFETVSYVESALIDMYAKGGNIKEAEAIFSRISNPDVVSMTTILSAYAYHGFAARALWIFERMGQTNVKPSDVTLLCVLSACSHAGLVDQGLYYFRSMERDYGLVPKMEHYACVVDLLCRVGRLDEAYGFITKEMAVEPDEMVWQTLLAGCRVHGNVELGKIAADKIMSLCPEHSSTYVLLSNTYMETGSFREGDDVRKVMREKGVRKEAGWSWILVKGRVHKFYAQDNDHPRRDDIYDKLEEMRMNMKALGYVPDFKFALLGED
ncbi:pentatricopeptide repeat-containing protein at3g49170 chloroplastic [Phtheirospermum japonicum]|uniref:Pentatricopeptide repeat-containing protein at3g49170 chloroplastic n=1 Tax=Phtheirospermum japonicum TaxID=374723 RepID=A0A830D2X9_9LAMI|nr:pentatricopeptide repeat-containing protein at3g49170 chloroplastic [Phtheirospermum japonicum]